MSDTDGAGSGDSRAVRVYQLLAGVTSGLYTLIFTLNLLYQVKVVGLSPLQLVLDGSRGGRVPRRGPDRDRRRPL